MFSFVLEAGHSPLTTYSGFPTGLECMTKLREAFNVYSASRIDLTEAACLKALLLFRPGKHCCNVSVLVTSDLFYSFQKGAVSWPDTRLHVSRIKLYVFSMPILVQSGWVTCFCSYRRSNMPPTRTICRNCFSGEPLAKWLWKGFWKTF